MTTQPDKERLWVPGRRGLIVVLLMSTVMGASGELTTAAVMPVIARDLHGDQLYGWAFSSLQLGTLVGTILAGTSADRRGPRFPFIIGKGLMCSGLVLIITAQMMVAVVIGRTVMGLGLGLFGGAAVAAQAVSVPSQFRTRLLTTTNSLWLPTAIVVPQAAAWLQQTFGWRVAYAPMVALAVLSLIIAAPVLPHRTERATTPAVVHNAIGIAVGAGLFFIALERGRLAVAVAMVIASGLLLTVSLRSLVPAGTFAAKPGLPTLVLIRAGFGFSVLVTEAFETLAIVTVRHQTTTVAALGLTAGSLGVTLGVWIHDRYASRETAERLLRVAVVVVAVGLLGFCASLSPSVPIALMLGFIALRSTGWGMAVNITGEAVMAMAEFGEEGRTTASSSMLQTLGFALGPGIGGAFVAASTAHGGGPTPGILASAGASSAVLLAIFLLVPRVGRGIAIPPRVDGDSEWG